MRSRESPNGQPERGERKRAAAAPGKRPKRQHGADEQFGRHVDVKSP